MKEDPYIEIIDGLLEGCVAWRDSCCLPDDLGNKLNDDDDLPKLGWEKTNQIDDVQIILNRMVSLKDHFRLLCFTRREHSTCTCKAIFCILAGHGFLNLLRVFSLVFVTK